MSLDALVRLILIAAAIAGLLSIKPPAQSRGGPFCHYDRQHPSHDYPMCKWKLRDA